MGGNLRIYGTAPIEPSEKCGSCMLLRRYLLLITVRLLQYIQYPHLMLWLTPPTDHKVAAKVTSIGSNSTATWTVLLGCSAASEVEHLGRAV